MLRLLAFAVHFCRRAQAYPDHGLFKMPLWEFEEGDIAAAKGLASEWISECGVCLLGGCCGTGPDLVSAFAELAAEHNARAAGAAGAVQ